MFAVALVVILVRRFVTKSKSVTAILIAIGVLLPTYDIIITNALGAYYCKADPNPKTFIKEKVEYPESIYWEDNVYPGFNEEDRKLMIMNYLDGIHLKTMALNGDNGKVYVYEVNSSTVWQPLKTLKYDSGKEHFNMINNIAGGIMQTSEKIYTKKTMPQMNYTVTFDEVKLNFFARKFLYSDETKAIDNKTGEVIAYNRRYMHFFYNIAPDFAVGNRYYEQDSICGYRYPNFDEMFNYKRVMYMGGIKHVNGLNQKLYNKYIKGE